MAFLHGFPFPPWFSPNKNPPNRPGAASCRTVLSESSTSGSRQAGTRVEEPLRGVRIDLHDLEDLGQIREKPQQIQLVNLEFNYHTCRSMWNHIIDVCIYFMSRSCIINDSYIVNYIFVYRLLIYCKWYIICGKNQRFIFETCWNYGSNMFKWGCTICIDEILTAHNSANTGVATPGVLWKLQSAHQKIQGLLLHKQASAEKPADGGKKKPVIRVLWGLERHKWQVKLQYFPGWYLVHLWKHLAV